MQRAQQNPYKKKHMASDVPAVNSGDESDEEDDDFSSSDDDEDYSWTSWFCSRKGHEFLCTVRKSIC